MNKMNKQKEIDKINNMDRIEMAKLIRFAPSGHPYFDSTKPYKDIFIKRFNSLGGFSAEISKKIGF